MARLNIRKIRREQIIEAANKIIATKGLMACTIEELEREADVSRGVITYHFRDKDEIVTEALANVLHRFDEQDRPKIREIPDPAKRLRKMMELGSTFSGRSEELYYILFNFLAQISHREDIRETVSAHLTTYREAVGLVVDYGMNEGEFRKVPLKEVCGVITAILVGLSTQQLVHRGEGFDLNKTASVAADMLLAYLKK